MSRDPALTAALDQAAAELVERAHAAEVRLDRDTVAFVVLDLLAVAAACFGGDDPAVEPDLEALAQYPVYYATIAATAVGATDAVAFLDTISTPEEPA